MFLRRSMVHENCRLSAGPLGKGDAAPLRQGVRQCGCQGPTPALRDRYRFALPLRGRGFSWGEMQRRGRRLILDLSES